jgi:hypothetical protein
MNDTRRTRRVFQPGVDSLEGRPLPSSFAGIVAPAAHVPQHLVQETQQLRLQEQRHAQHDKAVEIPREVQTNRKEQRPEQRATPFQAVSLTNAGAMSVVVGTPAPTVSSASSSSTSTPAGGGLQIHALAPNNLGAANAAMQGMSDGVATEETVISTGRGAGSAASTSSASSAAGSMDSSSTSTSTGMMATSTNGSSDGSSIASTVTNEAMGNMDMSTNIMMM